MDEMNKVNGSMRGLCDTVNLMNSSDYKDRFSAEYAQVAIRLANLKKMLKAWGAGTLPFTPTCPRSLYRLQLRAMEDYLAVLEARAAIENCDLPEVIVE